MIDYQEKKLRDTTSDGSKHLVLIQNDRQLNVFSFFHLKYFKN